MSKVYTITLIPLHKDYKQFKFDVALEEDIVDYTKLLYGGSKLHWGSVSNWIHTEVAKFYALNVQEKPGAKPNFRFSFSKR